MLPNFRLHPLRAIALIIGAVVLLALGAAMWWLNENARGVLPLITGPSQDIGALVESGESPFMLPDGFSVSVFTEDLHGPRVLTHDPMGTLVVSLPEPGKIVALPDTNNDGVSDRIVDVLSGLESPHGILFYENKLYVAEPGVVATYTYDPKTYAATGRTEILTLPTKGGGHSTRTLYRISTPEGEKLLVSVGSSCNVCVEEDEYRSTIISANFDGSDAKVYARGLRNSVFMATHPVTGELWATEMGRDLLGDDTPPDEVNIVKEEGNYGWPICYGKNIHDTDFDQNTYIRAPCTEPFETPSHIDLQAHSAPLGIAFIPEEGWPEALWHDAIVAFHGSWNREEPTGYKLVRLQLSDTGAYEGVEDFMAGFRTDGEVLGRPVDVMVEPGGLMYVTDDMAGVVYRIVYRGDNL